MIFPDFDKIRSVISVHQAFAGKEEALSVMPPASTEIPHSYTQ